MNKPKFFQSVLIEIKGDVFEFIDAKLKGTTLTERMGNEDGKCSKCGKNEWFLLPKESVCVIDGGKPYIECLNCGFLTHL